MSPPHLPDIATVAGLLKKTGAAVECDLRGPSMGTSIPDGSRLRLRFEEASRVSVGDVVAFDAAGTIIVHRIVARGRFGAARSHLLTRGDGTLLIDHPVPGGAVIGVIEAWQHGGGWQTVPAYAASGWRVVIERAFLWPVLAALHVHVRLAKALTVSVFTTRWLGQRVKRLVAPA